MEVSEVMISTLGYSFDETTPKQLKDLILLKSKTVIRYINHKIDATLPIVI